ncbi:MAG: hypothetical protein LBT00_10530 [Spirochaetaceae bacterium]|nr:hypothetical protein [Spirochaetaceae bacterium]
MRKKIIGIICNLFFLVPLFSQTVSFDSLVREFADAINPALPLAANMGLNWSTPYVGQIIGYPMHFGLGVFVGSAFMGNSELSALGEAMGLTIEESMIKGKQWLPNYAVVARIGGVADIPFDVGIKVGFLPDTALWGSLNYNSTLFGFDVHYAVHIPPRNGPVITVGLGYDRLMSEINGMGRIPDSDFETDELARIVWESHTITAQMAFSQPVLSTGLSLFGGVALGAGINRAGVKFGSDMNDPVYENMKGMFTLFFSGSAGIGYEIGVFRIDASFRWNFINFEPGLGIGFRYQR